MCKQALYLEDDQLMRMAVKMEADKRQMDLKIFSNSKDFLTAADNVSKETILFLDSDIGEKQRGEEIGKICFEKGFKTIYLVTSFDKNDFSNMPWIKGIGSKDDLFEFWEKELVN